MIYISSAESKLGPAQVSINALLREITKVSVTLRSKSVKLKNLWEKLVFLQFVKRNEQSGHLPVNDLALRALHNVKGLPAQSTLSGRNEIRRNKKCVTS